MSRLVVLVTVLVLGLPLAAADDRVPVRTHTTLLTPTGELVPAGAFQRGGNTALAFDLAFGITDRLEVRLHTAAVLFLADLQVRASVLPPDWRGRLVLGGSALATPFEGGHAWVGGSVTAAYRGGDRWSAHATARVARHAGHDDSLGLVTAGATLGVGRGHLLFLDVGQVAWHDPVDCAPPPAVARATAPAACANLDVFPGVAFGAWWRLRDASLGLSAVVLRVGDRIIPAGPLLSYSFGG